MSPVVYISYIYAVCSKGGLHFGGYYYLLRVFAWILSKKPSESAFYVFTLGLPRRASVSLVNKLFSMGFACWFALSQALLGMSAAYAQSGIDVEPPLIEHNIVSSVEAATRQSFFATVVDDDELDSVSLYYRYQNDTAYSAILMKRVSFSSTYIAHVPTAVTNERDIEYYIQARDKAGNRTVRGYAFNPLVREIKLAGPTPVVADTAATEKAAGTGKRRTILYVVLGVLTLGLLAGLSGGGSGGGGDDPEPNTGESCPNGICTVSITVGAP